MMKSIELIKKKKNLDTIIAVAEGLWNGIVVSAVLVVSVMLVRSVSFF